MSEQISQSVKTAITAIQQEYRSYADAPNFTGSISNPDMFIPDEARVVLETQPADPQALGELQSAMTEAYRQAALNTIESILALATPDTDYQAVGELMQATLLAYLYLNSAGIVGIADFQDRLTTLNPEFLAVFFNNLEPLEEPKNPNWAAWKKATAVRS